MTAEKEREPRLTARDAVFRSGYGPRAIRLSRDRTALFVGCKDGSVTMIDLAAAEKRASEAEAEICLCGAGATGVRSLCDLDIAGWLLLGQDDGGLSLLPWREVAPNEKERVPSPVHVPGLSQATGAVGYVGRWEGTTFIVSPRRTEAFFLEFELDRKTTSGGPGFTLMPGEKLPGVLAMSGFARLAEEERWIVGKTGALWWHGPEGLEQQDGLWELSGFERPGFVFDIAVVRSDPDHWPDHGIYLSTDEGVFLLRPPRPGDPPGQAGRPSRFGLEPVYLPGITETCMAVTHAVQGDHCLLWVSDMEGSVHLFWSDGKFWEDERGRRSRWRRSGLLERRFPVMRALASWTPGESHAALVGQACRDDRIVVSWYLSREAEPGWSGEVGEAGEDAREGPAELLSWGDVRRLRSRTKKEDWCIEALVADFIEKTGDDPESLRRFLRNPGADLAVSALADILKEDPSERGGQALTLWTHALIGTVHRRLESPGTQDYLGIIRWLRRIGESARFRELAQEYPDWAEDLRRSVDRNIQYARKWGVFGHTYAGRESALSALRPLQDQPGEERRFDLLVYESLLFRHRVDPQEVLPDPASHAFSPWDLQYFRSEGQDGKAGAEYVAVSWIDGGTVYRRSGAGEAWRDLTAEGRATPERAPHLGGRILLGDCEIGGERLVFLLSTPVPEAKPEDREERRLDRSQDRSEQIELRFLEDLHGAPAPPLKVAELLAPGDRAGPEAVYSLLALGEGRVAVGLEGTSGVARIGLLEVTPAGKLRALRQLDGTALPPIYPESKTLRRNPVWALASSGSSAAGTDLLVGCGDGQIWKLRLRFRPPSGYEIERLVLVGRLGAPVSALACRPRGAEEGGPLRVFAGGADGTLVAFEAVGEGRGDHEEYATLWATLERGPVRSLHTHQSPLVVDPEGPEGGKAEAQRLVLAVTQPGMAVLVLDRPGVERGPLEAISRPRVPGERLGRFSLRSTAFASALLPDVEQDEYPALARLLVVPATGGPRLLTFHHPKLTPSRRSAFRELGRRWLESLCGAGGRIQGHLLRQPETTYAVAPELPAVLVRWILPYDPEEKSWEERLCGEGPGDGLGPARQWLPRHLRPLVDLDGAWKRGEPLGGRLHDALLAAREVGDKALFKEILEAALSRANHQLYREALSGRGLPFAESFEALLADLEKVKGVWEGSSGRLDSRMRITIAKSLLDGDTLWSLARLHGEPRAGGGAEAPAERAMAASIRLVHRSLAKGDLLLALETLRAANLALLRLCRRLERSPEQDWSRAEPGRHFIRWEALRGLYQAVGDFAARIAHPKGNLGEVAAHEVCRAYALGMLACPPAIVQLAIWIAEADLPADTGKRVTEQLDLLEAVLRDTLPPLSQDLKDLLRIAFGSRPGGSAKDALFFPPEGRPWITEVSVGRGNLEMIQARKPFDDTVVWLHDLARQLTDEAGKVDLLRYRKLYGDITAVRSGKDQLRHSRQFWKKALEELDQECRKCEDLFAKPGETEEVGDGGVPLWPVRPELVLFSSTLQRWCQNQRKSLQGLRGEYQVFEPASSLYDEALVMVERAARRFGRGAAVQKNLVLGVLGHGLLELLDEHLLEVWEVAQALDPWRTWEQDEWERGDGASPPPSPPRPATSTASRFADYLLQRALKAEVIPKNLRSLQGLLSYTDEPGDPDLTLRSLLGEGKSWKVDLEKIPDEPLDRRTYHFLHLTLNELLQNDRMHGLPRPLDGGEAAQDGDLRPAVRADRSSGELALSFEFRYPPTDRKAVERAYALAEGRLQAMMPPREEPRVPSHGTGLYLANLAAGAVGWKLEPERPEEEGVLRFKLLRKGGEGR